MKIKARFLSILVLLALCGFAQRGFGAMVELPGNLSENQCQAQESAAQPDVLRAALAVSCSSSADCPCPDLCICKPRTGTCFCVDTCCPAGQICP